MGSALAPAHIRRLLAYYQLALRSMSKSKPSKIRPSANTAFRGCQATHLQSTPASSLRPWHRRPYLGAHPRRLADQIAARRHLH